MSYSRKNSKQCKISCQLSCKTISYCYDMWEMVPSLSFLKDGRLILKRLNHWGEGFLLICWCDIHRRNKDTGKQKGGNYFLFKRNTFYVYISRKYNFYFTSSVLKDILQTVVSDIKISNFIVFHFVLFHYIFLQFVST